MNHKQWMMIIPKVWRAKGVGGVLQAVFWQLIPANPRTLSLCTELVKGQHGLEIGGPSPLFMRKGDFPVYPHIARLDNCNFTHNTVWENNLSEGFTFKYDKERPAGYQYVSEATDLKKIPTGTFNFALSSHAIEHTANPMGAIREWLRVLDPNGQLLLVIPHMEGTCDHRRPITNLKHLIEDDQRKIGEDDMTHLPEILKLHDLDRDWGVSDFKAFKERSEKNSEFRCLHHHVFDTRLVVTMLDYMGLQILDVEAIRPFHIIAVAQKLSDGITPKNQSFLGSTAKWRQDSPFKIDRKTG
jgi:SAM-dependent methyltransferase